jgi:hypothetical protein
MESSELIPVYSAADPIKAHLVKNMLDAEGIRAFIDGENQAAFADLNVLEVKVLVEADRADEARNLIESHEKAALADEQAESESDSDE